MCITLSARVTIDRTQNFLLEKKKKLFKREKNFRLSFFSPSSFLFLLFSFFFSLSFLGQVYNLLFYTHTQNSLLHNVQYR